MVGEASGRMQKADCRDEIALPAAMLAWLKYRKQRTRNSRKRFLVFFCSLFVKARVVYRLPDYCSDSFLISVMHLWISSGSSERISKGSWLMGWRNFR